MTQQDNLADEGIRPARKFKILTYTDITVLGYFFCFLFFWGALWKDDTSVQKGRGSGAGYIIICLFALEPIYYIFRHLEMLLHQISSVKEAADDPRLFPSPLWAGNFYQFCQFPSLHCMQLSCQLSLFFLVRMVTLVYSAFLCTLGLTGWGQSWSLLCIFSHFACIFLLCENHTTAAYSNVGQIRVSISISLHPCNEMQVKSLPVVYMFPWLFSVVLF